ncbi:MAG: recombinase family protein [Lachnospiraceae bacterium]|nr:recombinase family protein [Lachnospiraceae bacterium]
MRKITKIEQTVPKIPERKKVAAYARVSMETERLHHSLSAQVSYYSELIQRNPKWEYAGVYADEAISGTSVNRPEFQRMLADCEAGKIDIILAKSISRFARNTVDLLNVVRHLKELSIEVRFEKEKINSLSSDGELMLTLLASFAQEESISISNNVKWGVRKRMQEGIPNGHPRVLGYRWEGDQLVIVPEEAEIVKRVFQNFLDGKSRLETEREFEAEGIRSINGCVMRDSNLKTILSNITYTGNLLLQKEYISDPIDKKRKKNRGELPQYFVENTHEPIIDMETFQYVQDEMARRKELGALANKSLNICCFTGKIKCPYCSLSYMHNARKPRTKYGQTLEFWVCGSRKKKGGHCDVKGSINQRSMEKVLADVLELDEFDENIFLSEIDVIYVPKSYTLEIHFKDGRVITKDCPNTGHQECWTPEYRERVSKQRRKFGTNPKGASCLTSKIKCEQCGCNFRKQTQRHTDGSTVTHWRCSAPEKTCGTVSLREDLLKQMTAEVLGIEQFDDDTFLERIDHISVVSATELVFHMKDGSTVSREWVKPKKTMPPWTEERREKQTQAIRDSFTPERRQAMSEKMKQIRSEKYWASTKK